MAPSRYVVMGLAPPRAQWFRMMAQWATAATIPVEFVKCLSAEELRAQLDSPRTFSAALIDASLPALDRDLLEVAATAACPVIVIDRHNRAHWCSLGASAVLGEQLDREELLGVLRSYAHPIVPGDPLLTSSTGTLASAAHESSEPGKVIALCGSGGTGVSTLAMALAQAFACNSNVVLADLARRAQQGMLHDARDVVPSIQELTDAHRGGQLDSRAVQALTFYVQERGYHLLLGLRRPSAWSSLRARAFASAFEALSNAFDVLVVDTDADLEGEREGGSADVEERNLMARHSLGHADVVIAVGRPGLKGLHSLLAVVADVLALGVPAARVIPVINAAPRQARIRSEMSKAYAELAELLVPSPVLESNKVGNTSAIPNITSAIAAPLFIPERNVEGLIRDLGDLPEAMVKPLVIAVQAVLDRLDPATLPRDQAHPFRVTPGSLGHWASEQSSDEAGGGAASMLG